MTNEEIIRMAEENWNASQPHFNHWENLTERGRLVLVITASLDAEQKRCIEIIYGQCGSDNVAQRTVDAIRSQS
jgi:hypothetical protein